MTGARLMGEALLDWMYADVAVNSFECSMLPPLNREKGLLNGTYQRGVPTGIGPWISWLLFGGGHVPEGDGPFPEGLDPMHSAVCCHALSTWSPHPVIRNIAAKRLTLPYTLHQSRAPWAHIEPTMVNDFEKKAIKGRAAAAPHVREHLRSVYFEHDYAIGAGYFRTAPEDPMTRSNLPFGVWWRSMQEHNFLLVSHPYWFAELPGEDGEPAQGDNDWLGISPFCRMVHHENAAVLLYDLPEKDPYVDMEQRGSTKLRVQRSGKIIPSIFVYVPETVHERVETAAWFFVRENDIYIGIRPLTPGAKWATSSHRGFDRIAIPGRLTGVVIEMGDRREYGSFQDFQSKVASAKVDTSRLASEKSINYLSTRGHRLSVSHVPDTWLPSASVNGTKLNFDVWPISESPYVKSRDHVLDVNDGAKGFAIDWSGEYPAYTYYDVREGQRTDTSRRFLREGKLVTEVL